MSLDAHIQVLSRKELLQTPYSRSNTYSDSGMNSASTESGLDMASKQGNADRDHPDAVWQVPATSCADRLFALGRSGKSCPWETAPLVWTLFLATPCHCADTPTVLCV